MPQTSGLNETSGLKWLFLDLDSYFASVEQQLNPELRGRPVAVTPVMADTTCAIAASYEAKAFGIETGTPIYQARKLCPDLRLVVARHDLYVRFHHRIVEEIEDHIPITQVCSIDEVACELLGAERARTNVIALAQRIKRGLAENVGVCLRCSIGVAPNRFLAKVATGLQKPDGLVLIEPRDLPERLLGLDLRDLPGIGASMERRLRAAGIFDLAALWSITPRHARRIWNSVVGESFWHALHGAELPEPPTTRRSVGHSHVLAPRLRAADQARLVARRLAVKAASRLRRMGYVAAMLSLGVRLTNGGRWKGAFRVGHADDNSAFLNGLERLWREMLIQCRAVRIKRVSVLLDDLIRASDITPDLFAARPDGGPGERLRQERLSLAMDSLNRRYGRDTVVLGALPNPEANFVGTKVAFTRIPDLAEFYE